MRNRVEKSFWTFPDHLPDLGNRAFDMATSIPDIFPPFFFFFFLILAKII